MRVKTRSGPPEITRGDRERGQALWRLCTSLVDKPRSSENLHRAVRLDSDNVVSEPALGSMDPAPSEASVCNCSRLFQSYFEDYHLALIRWG